MGSHYRETALIVERKNESERHIERKLTKIWQKKKRETENEQGERII